MRYPLRMALLSSGFFTLFVAGCASSSVDEKDIHALGHAEVVYLQPPTNLGVFQAEGAVGSNPSIPVASQILAAGLIDYKNGQEVSSLDARSDDIKALKFDDQVHALVATIVSETPWLNGSSIKTVAAADVQHEDSYTEKSSADSVIYIQPYFSMLTGNQRFIVDVKVEIQKKSDPKGTNDFVHTVASQEFRFDHKLSLLKPGMSWAQQKELAQQVAAMNMGQALSEWLADNAALLQGGFSQDLPQIDQGLKVFFGDAQKTPGG
jgi:hypothetical protein